MRKENEMKRLMILIAITFIAVGALAVQKKVLLKCDSDSYVAQLSPDTNYGTSRELLSQIKFTFDGTNRINNDNKIAYLHYAMPSELTGKVQVLGARYYFFVIAYKGNSPYPAGEGTFTFGLYPCLASWNENTITYNNQPPATGPAFYTYSSPKFSYAQAGINHLDVGPTGLAMLQRYVDTGSSFGMAWYLDVSPTTDGTLAVGDYANVLAIASREAGRRLSYIVMNCEVGTGNLINGSNINPSTLGEVKALYR
jgi:hypothetical protein